MPIAVLVRVDSKQIWGFNLELALVQIDEEPKHTARGSFLYQKARFGTAEFFLVPSDCAGKYD